MVVPPWTRARAILSQQEMTNEFKKILNFLIFWFSSLVMALRHRFYFYKQNQIICLVLIVYNCIIQITEKSRKQNEILLLVVLVWENTWIPTICIWVTKNYLLIALITTWTISSARHWKTLYRNSSSFVRNYSRAYDTCENTYFLFHPVNWLVYISYCDKCLT